ncbi:MATE family efflux transporter [Luteithermobacter gelatinilyticus]|uniref:MATE family efflux transporter n=1 Tax=Luteithermobacter gelatinilyticus TaxID=2582913 RepID=UPI00143D33CC|nr:MATE family efflux transporter [Luteithermobacter gelatinilyticus]
MPSDNWFRDRLKRQLSELLRLSFPIVLQRLGIMLMGIVDVIMVGRYSAEELAYAGIANVPASTVIVIGIGLLMGVMVLSSNALGAQRYRECGRIWQRGMVYGLGLGILAAGICLAGEEILLMLNQAPELARGGGAVLKVLALGMPLICLMLVCSFFLEGIGRPLPGMIFMILANLLNIFLNWVFVYGHLGFDPMGAVGSAWATTSVRLFLVVALVSYILTMKDADQFGIRQKVDLTWRKWKRLRHIGYGAGLTNGAEHLGFVVLSIFAGWIGTIALGATTIALNILGLPFMMSVGIAGATAVRVGLAHGRRDCRDMMLAGTAGLGLNILVIFPVALVMGIFAPTLALLFSTEAELIRELIPLVGLVSWLLVFDTSQAVMGNALRGRQDIWFPTLIYIFAYNVVQIPLVWVLAFPLGHGTRGLFEGIIYTSILSFILLSSRFFYLSHADLQREKHQALP